jgi:hypothetical protein
MIRALLLLVLLSPCSTALGAWTGDYLTAKGARCSAYERVVEGARHRGHHCVLPQGFLDTYPHPVALHVPDQFVTQETLNAVLYLHGLSDHTKPIPYDYVDSLFGHDMGVALSMSAANAVLIMPGGTAGNAAFKRYLTATSTHFDRFMNELVTLLNSAGLSQAPKLKRFVVAGHSGAHRPLRQLLTAPCQEGSCYRDRITELYLLDASYVMEGSEGIPFSDFAKRPGKRLHVVFRGGTVTADNSRVLYNHVNGTAISDTRDFCRQHKTDLRTPLPCQFTCVTNQTLRTVAHWKRGPSLHYKVAPIFLWRLLDAKCVKKTKTQNEDAR